MKLIKLISAVFIFLIALNAFADQNPDAQKAEALLKDGKREEAYQMYMSLFRANPDNVTITYGLARSALTDHPNQAVAALEHLVARYPYNRLFVDDLAKAYTALGDKETGEIYTSAAPKRRVSRSSARYEVHGGLRWGGIYDSNANLGPSSGYVRFGDYFIALDDAKQTASYGAYVGSNIDVGYRISPGNPWRLAWDAGVYARYNFNDKLKDMDRDFSEWYRVAGGIKGVFATRLIDVRVKTELYDNSFYQTIYSYGAELTFLQAVLQKYHFITYLSRDKRDYIRNEDNTGTYIYAGEYFRVYFGNAPDSITIGGRYSAGDVNNENYSYNGWDTSISARINFQRGWMLSPQASYGT
jgi:hypothetical protein